MLWCLPGNGSYGYIMMMNDTKIKWSKIHEESYCKKLGYLMNCCIDCYLRRLHHHCYKCHVSERGLGTEHEECPQCHNVFCSACAQWTAISFVRGEVVCHDCYDVYKVILAMKL